MRTRSLALAALLSGLALPALAAIPSTIPFQTRLVDDTGSPVAPGTVVVCSIYDDETAGNELWGPETHTVTPTNGIVSIFLGDGDTPDPIDENVFGSGDRFLELTVAGETMTPRIRMTSSAYAFRAESVSPGAINGTALATNSVTSAKIADNSVTGSDIASNTVTAADIAADAVGNSELANNAVASANVVDNSLTANDLATNSVGASEIAADAVGASELANNAVASANVADNSLTASDLATNSVTASEIATNAVGSAEIASSAVGNSELATNAVNDTKISDEPGGAYIFTDTDKGLAPGVIVEGVSETINIPTSGLVLCLGTANFRVNHGFDDSEVFASITTSTGAHNGGSLVRHQIPIEVPASPDHHVTLAPQRILRFTTSGNKTIRLNVELDDGISATLLDANLTLVFIPTEYGDVSTAAQDAREEADFDGASR